MEFERTLLVTAAEIAGLAVPTAALEAEPDRVEAAHRHARLIGELHLELGIAVRPDGR